MKRLVFSIGIILLTFPSIAKTDDGVFVTKVPPQGIFYWRQRASTDVIGVPISGSSNTLGVMAVSYYPWEKVNYKFVCRDGVPYRSKLKNGYWIVLRDTGTFQAMREDNVLMEFPISMKASICQ